MQNLCARSNVSNSADVNADQFSHPYKAFYVYKLKDEMSPHKIYHYW